ncbi:MAG TPA: 50S ribosomal protein L21 [Alphaproteobacteria bacterium]
MQAVIRTGGKQYRVAANDVIKVERLAGDAGEQVVFGEVLSLSGDGSAEVGAPLISGASVAARVIAQDRADKIVIFKKRRRHNYRRTKGHRQHLTVLRIEEILTGGAKPTAPAKIDPKVEEKPTAAAAEGESRAEAAPKPAAKAKTRSAAKAKPAKGGSARGGAKKGKK